jgi:hypothetical protein
VNGIIDYFPFGMLWVIFPSHIHNQLVTFAFYLTQMKKVIPIQTKKRRKKAKKSQFI